MVHTSYLQTLSRRSLQTIAVIATIAVVIALWIAWHFIYMSPNHVFWGMISNNLSTTSITKHNKQTASTQTNDEYTEVNFVGQPTSHDLITVSQGSGKTATVVKSETIGTLTTDYSRYISITTNQKTAKGKPIDTSKITNKWGKSSSTTSGQASSSQYFQQSVLGLVPFANLTPAARTTLVHMMKSDNVYDYTLYGAKSTRFAGKAAYVYTVQIKPQAYVEMLNQYAKDIGLGNIGLDPSQYAASQPIQVRFTVAKASRQLLQLQYATGETETYSSQGLETNVVLPTKTIPTPQLQTLVQQALQ